jgi:hypothetical protein
MIKVAIHFVDGGYDERQFDDRFVIRLRELRRDEQSEREIIDDLLGDDWAAPPSYVTVTGVLRGGDVVQESLSYTRE